MIPVLYKFTFETMASQVALYLVALALVFYAARSGWMGAHGQKNAKTGEFGAPSRNDQIQRAVIFGAIGLGLAVWGLKYALPWMPILGKGEGQGIPIHTYGVLLGAGFLLAVMSGSLLARREWPGEEGEKKRDQVFDFAFWLFVGGIVGSRIFFIIVNWEDFWKNPSPFGGLVFYGGLVGALITGFVYARTYNIDFLRIADVAMPCVSLGQCLGRLGCFSAGCCWGDIAKAHFPFAVHFPGGTEAKNLFGGATHTASLAFDGQSRDTRYVVEATAKLSEVSTDGAVKISEWVAQHGHTLGVHPTQLYESIGQLTLFLVFLSLRRVRIFHGQILGMWLMSYAVLRSTIELFRGDSARGTLHGLLTAKFPELASRVPLDAWYNISFGQIISACMFTIGAVILYRQWRAKASQPSIDLEALQPA